VTGTAAAATFFAPFFELFFAAFFEPPAFLVAFLVVIISSLLLGEQTERCHETSDGAARPEAWRRSQGKFKPASSDPKPP
jgi:hypothetical protein